ncbi:MAG: PDZ domain-containing protein [Anaerolineae bacterium]|nr:PDZ domain-containing protein [Anaerolineae bacterium]
MAATSRTGQHLALAALVLIGLVLCALGGAVVGGGVGYYLGRRAGESAARGPARPPAIIPPDLPRVLPAPPDWSWPWRDEQPGSRMKVAARVVEVVAGSPAQRAGLQAGDLIVAVDGQPLTPARDLGWAISTHKPGDHVELTLERGGAQEKISVTLEASSDDPERPYLGVRFAMQFSVEMGIPGSPEGSPGRSGELVPS